MGTLTGLTFFSLGVGCPGISGCPEKLQIAVLGCPSPANVGATNMHRSYGPSPVPSGAPTSRPPHTVSGHANLNVSATVL